DVVREVAVAVLDPVEAGFGAEEAEPGRPYVRGDEVAAVAQDGLQQVAGVHEEGGAAVGGEVGGAAQFGVERCRGVEVGHVDEVVDLAGAAAGAVNRGDLHREHEPHRRGGQVRGQVGAGRGVVGLATPAQARLRSDTRSRRCQY